MSAWEKGHSAFAAPGALPAAKRAKRPELNAGDDDDAGAFDEEDDGYFGGGGMGEMVRTLSTLGGGSDNDGDASGEAVGGGDGTPAGPAVAGRLGCQAAAVGAADEGLDLDAAAAELYGDMLCATSPSPAVTATAGGDDDDADGTDDVERIADALAFLLGAVCDAPAVPTPPRGALAPPLRRPPLAPSEDEPPDGDWWRAKVLASSGVASPLASPSRGTGSAAASPTVAVVPEGWDPADGAAGFRDEVTIAKAMFDELFPVVRRRKAAPVETVPAAAAAASPPGGDEGPDENDIDVMDPDDLLGVKVQVLSLGVLDEARAKRGGRSKGLFVSCLRPALYPHAPLEVTIEPWHNIFTTAEVSALYSRLNEHSRAAAGDASLLGLLGCAAEEAQRILQDGLATEFDAAKTARDQAVLAEAGLRTRRTVSARVAPSNYVGSISELIAKIPKGYDVLHTENILRDDLAMKFEQMQRLLFQKYVKPHMKTRGMRLDPRLTKLADVQPCFHGTRTQYVGQIVRNGLLVPGQDTGVRVRVGCRYGVGIYTSPNPELALWYAEHGGHQKGAEGSSVKLLVVATLPGKACVIYDGEEPWGGGCRQGYDSHLSADGEQVVLFKQWQALPCYVLHLSERKQKLTRDHEQYGVVTDKHSASGLAGVKGHKDRRALLTALARKNLPYGFGPAGANFVVEDMAPYEDDEEDWGEYVADARAAAGGDALEEYQHETMLARTRGLGVSTGVVDPEAGTKGWTKTKAGAWVPTSTVATKW